MKALAWVLASLFLLTLTTGVAAGQPLSLRGSSSLEINFGLWSQFRAGQELSASGVHMSAKTNGFVGGLTYCYWMRENVALTVSGSLLSAQAKSDMSTIMTATSSFIYSPVALEQTSNVVASFLVGTRLYVLQDEPGDDIRPYIAVSIGSFMGFEASNTLLSQSARTESAFGGRVGAGLDVFLGSSVKLGANVGYDAMTDFQYAVGARKNFNGFDASIGIGFLF